MKTMEFPDPKVLVEANWSQKKPDDVMNSNDYFRDAKKTRGELESLGMESIDRYQGAHVGEPCLILGSGPSYRHADVSRFKGVVIGCNAAAIYEKCTYGIAADSSAAVKLAKDVPVPFVVRSNPSHIGQLKEMIEHRKKKKMPEMILFFPPMDCIQVVQVVSSQPTLYTVRMTGTLACILAGIFGCSPVIMAGIDYVPFGPKRISRYDVTPWYRPPDTHDRELVSFRGHAVASSWKVAIELAELWAREYSGRGGLVFKIADEGLVKIPKMPDVLRRVYWRRSLWSFASSFLRRGF